MFVSLSALASSLNSLNDTQVCPRRSETDTSCRSCLQRDSGGRWAPKPAEEETEDKMKEVEVFVNERTKTHFGSNM